jgi:hypothetical protein
MQASSEFSDLESAVLENLEVRGVISRLEAALSVEVRAALSGPRDPGEELLASRAFSAHPDRHLADALVAEYLQATGCMGALSAFCAEADVPRPDGAPLPGASLSAPPPAVPLVGAASFSAPAAASMGGHDAIGAIAHALSTRAAEPLLAGALSGVGTALPRGDGEAARETVSAWLRARAARQPPSPSSSLTLPGGLERALVASELGLPPDSLRAPRLLPAAHGNGGGAAGDRDESLTLPLLFALVGAARQSATEGVMAVPGWLAPGAREGLAAAAAAIGESARAAAAAAAAAAAPQSAAAAAAATVKSHSATAEFDSDEDLPGIISRMQAAQHKSAATEAAAAEAASLARARFGVGSRPPPRADASALFATTGGATTAASHGLIFEGAGV